MASGIAAESIAGLSIAGLAIAAAGSQAVGYVTQYPPGTYTFTPPKTAEYKFIQWGGGGVGTSSHGGCSGSYAETTVRLDPTKPVSIVVGDAGADTTVTLPGSGRTITSGAGTNTVVGVATGGDVNLNGSLWGVDGLGTGAGLQSGGAVIGAAGAPANLPHRGGSARTLQDQWGHTPGSGGQVTSGPLSGLILGGDGLVIVELVRP